VVTLPWSPAAPRALPGWGARRPRPCRPGSLEGVVAVAAEHRRREGPAAGGHHDLGMARIGAVPSLFTCTRRAYCPPRPRTAEKAGPPRRRGGPAGPRVRPG